MPRHRRCTAPGALSIPRPRRQPHRRPRLLPVRCCAPAPPAAFPLPSSLRRRFQCQLLAPEKKPYRLDAPHLRRAREPDRFPSPTPSASCAARVGFSCLSSEPDRAPRRFRWWTRAASPPPASPHGAADSGSVSLPFRSRQFFRRHPQPPSDRSPSRAPRPASPPVPQRAEKNSRRRSQRPTGSRSAASAAPDSTTGANFFSCLRPLARRSRFPSGRSIGSRAAPHRGSLPLPRIVRGVLLDLLSFLRPAAFSLTPDAPGVPPMQACACTASHWLQCNQSTPRRAGKSCPLWHHRHRLVFAGLIQP